MARGTTLANLRQMLRAEVGEVLNETAAPGEVARQSLLLSNTQKWLAAKFDFQFLKARATVALTPGTRLYTFPETEISLERLPGSQAVKLQSVRYAAEYGISQADLAQWDSDDATQRADPVRKWDLVNSGTTLKLEVWPLPATAQTFILTGRRPLRDLAVDADTCDLDDLLIVYYTGAKLLARDHEADAQALLAQAQARFQELKGAMPASNGVFILGGGGGERNFRRSLDRRPTIAVSPQ